MPFSVPRTDRRRVLTSLALLAMILPVGHGFAQSGRDAQDFDSGSLKRLYDRSRPTQQSRVIRAQPIRGEASTSSEHARIVRPIEEDIQRVQQISNRRIITTSRDRVAGARYPYVSHGLTFSTSLDRRYGVDSLRYGSRFDDPFAYSRPYVNDPSTLRTTSGYGYYPLGVYNHPTVFGRSDHTRAFSLRTNSGYGYYPLGVYNHPTVFEQPRFPSHHHGHHRHHLGHHSHHGHRSHSTSPVILRRSAGFGRHEAAHKGVAPSRAVTPVPRGAAVKPARR